MFQGALFARDFLTDSVARLDEWRALDDATVDEVETDLRSFFDRFPTGPRTNESQTEDDLIWPVLARLGWAASLRQQNLTAQGAEDVPDGLLFADEAAKDRANRIDEQWRRYGLGLAIVESKRWALPLDGRSDRPREHRAVHADAALPAAGGRPDDGPLPLGHPHQRPRLAALPCRRAFRRGAVLRGRSRRRARRAGLQRGAVRPLRGGPPSRAASVRPDLRARCLPPGRHGFPHVPSAGHRRGRVLRTARRREPGGAGLRPRLPRSRPRRRRRRARGAAPGGAGRRPDAPLPAPVHPLRRGP